MNNNTINFEPVHRHQSEELIEANAVVSLDIAIWPTSRYWHAGEILRLIIAHHHILEDRGWDWFEVFKWDTRNVGEHVVHAGGDHDSYLQLPVIPAKRPSTFVEPCHRLTPGIRSKGGGAGTYR